MNRKTRVCIKYWQDVIFDRQLSTNLLQGCAYLSMPYFAICDILNTAPTRRGNNKGAKVSKSKTKVQIADLICSKKINNGRDILLLGPFGTRKDEICHKSMRARQSRREY